MKIQFSSFTFRRKLLLAAILVLGLSNLTLVALTTATTSRHTLNVRLAATQRNSELLSSLIIHKIKTATDTAEIALSYKNPDEQVTALKGLVSAVSMQWQGDDFTYEKRIDSAHLIKTKKLDVVLLTESIHALHADIISSGSTQEQIFTGLAGPEMPVLFVLTPTQKNVSLLTILEASPLLAALKDPTGSRTYLVDRFGTIVLHPEETRAISRESAVQSPIVKKLFNSTTQHEMFTYTEGFSNNKFYGWYARIPFAGLAIISEIDVQSSLFPVGPERALLALACVTLFMTMLSGFFLILSATKKEPEAEALLAS